MKTINLFVLLLLFSLSSCFEKEKKDAMPDLASKVTGKYQLTWVDYWDGRYDLPKPGIEGTMTIERINETTVKQTYYIKFPSKHYQYDFDTYDDVDTVRLRPQNQGEVYMWEDAHISSDGTYYESTKEYKVGLQYKNLGTTIETKFKKVN